jgi:hypothetical protein
VRVRVIDADDQNPAFYFDKYAAQIPGETSQGVKLQVEHILYIDMHYILVHILVTLDGQ